MAPRLKLPNNFHVRCFGSICNNKGIGKYLPQNTSVANDDFAVDIGGHEVTHISETQLSQLLIQPANGRPPLEEIVVYSVVAALVLELSIDDECCILGKRKLHSCANKSCKRKRTTPATITRKWQQVWSCQFT